MKNRSKNLKILKELFWDYKWNSVLKKLDSPFVIARVLEIGNKKQVKEFEKAVGIKKIKDFLKNYENLLSKQSLNFWRLCYEVKSKKTSKRTLGSDRYHFSHTGKMRFLSCWWYSFIYLYPLLKPFLHLNSLKLASLEDILCMKINAIILRGSTKDFIDVYFIMKNLKIKSDEVIKLFVKKFGKYEELVIKKALTYFEDAEREPEIPIFKNVKWNAIKNFFIKEFAKI